MRIDLAAQVHIVTYMRHSKDHNDILHEQVLSSTIAKALTLRFGSSSAATAQFIQLMDSFFDCLNVGNYTMIRQFRRMWTLICLMRLSVLRFQGAKESDP